MAQRTFPRLAAATVRLATMAVGTRAASADSCHSACPGGQNGGYSRTYPASSGIWLGGHDIAGYTGEGGGAGRFGVGGYGIAGVGRCGGNVNAGGPHVNGSACP